MQCRDCLTDLGGWGRKGVTPRRAAFRHCREEPALAEAQADAGAGSQAFGQPFHVIPAKAGTQCSGSIFRHSREGGNPVVRAAYFVIPA